MRAIDYLKHEGVAATVKKVLTKLQSKMGGSASRTIFFVSDNPIIGDIGLADGYSIRQLSESDSREFSEINFFPHIDTDSYLSSSCDGAFGCFFQGAMCGYVCFETKKLKHLHGTGDFALNDHEAWIGPCYVQRNHRGKGLNGAMVRFAMKSLSKLNINHYFTAINGANISSLASFDGNGFRRLGFFSRKRGLICDSENTCLTDRLDA
mgnify:CR=1 FL=1